MFLLFLEKNDKEIYKSARDLLFFWRELTKKKTTIVQIFHI